MALPEPPPDPARQQLKELRETLLSLHKALLDSERTSYELVHGTIASPGAFLQLLINDNWFAWLRPVTTLLVEIDEALAAKNPPRTSRDFVQLREDTRALLSPSRDANGFWKRYQGTLNRDPGVAVLHEQMERQLAGDPGEASN
ncbi:MAG: hypothetical protein JO217_07780 [Acidobacteriaceae bacterium]|nr:hypothetical protein [Acidobacteriaceae bacterium]MBV9442581.1 hypothetical protein [Acidobacteriaceae bacterium]